MKKGWIIAGLLIVIGGSAYLLFSKKGDSKTSDGTSGDDTMGGGTSGGGGGGTTSGGGSNTSSGGVSFKKGQKLKPKQPLIKAKAYDRKTGKFIAYFTSAIFEAKSNSKDWIFATVNVLGSGYAPSVPTSVQLKTNDWI